jgi:hypothetical protein
MNPLNAPCVLYNDRFYHKVGSYNGIYHNSTALNHTQSHAITHNHTQLHAITHNCMQLHAITHNHMQPHAHSTTKHLFYQEVRRQKCIQYLKQKRSKLLPILPIFCRSSEISKHKLSAVERG